MIWSSFDAVVYPFLLIVTTPVFVSKLGVEMYGIWMFVNTIIASIGILNAGLADGTIKFISKYIALEQPDKVHHVIRATYSIYLILSALVILVAFVISYSIKSFDAFDIEDKYRSVVFMSIIIAGITLSLKFIEQIFLAVFKGYERYDISSKIAIVGKILIISTNAVLAYLHCSLIIILLSTCVLTFLFLLVEAFLVYRFSGFASFVPFFEKIYVKEVFSFGIWTWAQSVLGIISGQVDKFIVISLSDIKTFAYYSIALTIFTQIHSCFAAAISWIFPVVSRKIYKGEEINSFYNQTQFYFLSGVTMVLVLFSIVKDPLIIWWLGEESYSHTVGFINWFNSYNLVMVVTIIPAFFLNASGFFKINTLFTLLNLISRLIFIPLFYYWLGSEGLVIGLIVSAVLVIPIQMNIFFKQVLDSKNVLIGLKIIVSFILFGLVSYYKYASLSITVCAILILYYAYIFNFKLGLKKSDS